MGQSKLAVKPITARSRALPSRVATKPTWRHRNGAPLNFSGMLASQDNADAVSDGPEVLQTMMNHVAFRDYHLFRSETRIITGDESTPADAAPTPVPRPN